jgi:3-phytase
MLTFLLAALADIRPAFATAPVGTDADDPAIWVHPTDRSRSRILGTDKTETHGGLYVFDLRGRVVQRIGGLDRPNNVDVEGDLAVVTERKKERLRIFSVDRRTGRLTDTTGETRVFEGETGEDAAPMGIALYRRPKDGAVFATVTPKAGPREGHLAQYRIARNPRTGRYDAFLVRRFGRYSGVKETESVCVDDALGFVYYSDETVGTRKYLADPDAPNADRELAFFNRTGTKGDHEGIAIWARPNGTGYLVCTDQIKGNSVYRVFRREGNNAFVGTFRGGADETDGIEMTSTPLGPRFPRGLFVAMNSGPKNFLVFDARDILRVLVGGRPSSAPRRAVRSARRAR